MQAAWSAAMRNGADKFCEGALMMLQHHAAACASTPAQTMLKAQKDQLVSMPCSVLMQVLASLLATKV